MMEGSGTLESQLEATKVLKLDILLHDYHYDLVLTHARPISLLKDKITLYTSLLYFTWGYHNLYCHLPEFSL